MLALLLALILTTADSPPDVSAGTILRDEQHRCDATTVYYAHAVDTDGDGEGDVIAYGLLDMQGGEPTPLHRPVRVWQVYVQDTLDAIWARRTDDGVPVRYAPADFKAQYRHPCHFFAAPGPPQV